MKEEEIRPEKIFNKYLQLAKNDIKKYFKVAKREPITCPACDRSGEYAFTKNGFIYEECHECLTLFVSPRPDAESFFEFYEKSDSVNYWASTFYKETAEARRDKIWKPKAKMINDIIKQHGAMSYEIIDIGGGFGMFSQEYEKEFQEKVTVIEPGHALAAACREKGIVVIQNFLEDIKAEQLSSRPKIFVSFELFEHLHSPQNFLKNLLYLMKSGDLFVFTTLSGVGVDIQALQKHSKSVSPPHHINFFNPKSASILLKNTGFDVLDVRTPGKLDIDILTNNLNKIKDKFWHSFIVQSTEEEKENMQKFISDNGWSSHMLVVCKKP